MHGTLSEVEELPIGPELNDFGQVQEREGFKGARQLTRLGLGCFATIISAKPATDEPG